MRGVLAGLFIVGVLLVSASVSVSAIESNRPLAWIREFGTAGLDAARAVAMDHGKVYAAGLVDGALPDQDSAGGSDVFLQRYNSGGKEMWTRQFGTPGDDAATVVGSLAVDDRNVYLGGLVSGALPGQSYAGDWDAFVRRYDPAGQEVWTRQFGTAGPDAVQGISANQGSVYVGGFTSGALLGQTHAGGADAFVRMYDENGDEVWTRQFGTQGTDYVWSVAAGDDCVYVVGQTDGALPGQTSAGGTDAFIRKYSVGGDDLWTRQFGTSSSDALHGVAVHGEAVFAAGEVQGTLPDQTSAGGFDAFVQKYDSTGETA